MRQKHRNDHNHGKNGFVGGNPRYNRAKENRMAKKRTKTQDATSGFTQREREQFLYHTAEEMRIINDRADSRIRNDVQREEQSSDQSAPDELWQD